MYMVKAEPMPIEKLKVVKDSNAVVLVQNQK